MRPLEELHAITTEVMLRMAKRGYELAVEPGDANMPHGFRGRFVHHGGVDVHVHLPHDVPTGDPAQKFQSPAVEHVCREFSRQRFNCIHNIDPATGKPR